MSRHRHVRNCIRLHKIHDGGGSIRAEALAPAFLELIDFFSLVWHITTLVLPLAATPDLLEVAPAGATAETRTGLFTRALRPSGDPAAAVVLAVSALGRHGRARDEPPTTVDRIRAGHPRPGDSWPGLPGVNARLRLSVGGR
jgi:hypothetical protein